MSGCVNSVWSIDLCNPEYRKSLHNHFPVYTAKCSPLHALKDAGRSPARQWETLEPFEHALQALEHLLKALQDLLKALEDLLMTLTPTASTQGRLLARRRTSGT